MLKHFYSSIIYFKLTHPIQFWGVVFLAILLFFLIANAYRVVQKLRRNRFLKRLTSLVGYTTLTSIALLAGFIQYQYPSKFTENVHLSNNGYVFGIDVSHYQGKINWPEVKQSKHPIKFVFVRATMGKDGKDKRFEENFVAAKKYGYIRGAYHYYRPSENSTQQFANFKQTFKFQKGDFYPVLDIEDYSKYGNDNLRKGVKNWLTLTEQTYGVKPIIYTGLDFYKRVIKGHFKGYPLWIAAYHGTKSRLKGINWDFHQFTDRVRIKGIYTPVDGNDFKGSISEIKKLVK